MSEKHNIVGAQPPASGFGGPIAPATEHTDVLPNQPVGGMAPVREFDPLDAPPDKRPSRFETKHRDGSTTVWDMDEYGDLSVSEYDADGNMIGEPQRAGSEAFTERYYERAGETAGETVAPPTPATPAEAASSGSDSPTAASGEREAPSPEREAPSRERRDEARRHLARLEDSRKSSFTSSEREAFMDAFDDSGGDLGAAERALDPAQEDLTVGSIGGDASDPGSVLGDLEGSRPKDEGPPDTPGTLL